MLTHLKPEKIKIIPVSFEAITSNLHNILLNKGLSFRRKIEEVF